MRSRRHRLQINPDSGGGRSFPVRREHVILLRSAEGAERWAEPLAAAGFRVSVLASLGTEATSVPWPEDVGDWWLFTSPAAVRAWQLALAAGRAPWPQGAQIAAVGPGTADGLAHIPGLETPILRPQGRFDSEALLALLLDGNPPRLRPGQTVTLVQGEGGREALADGLEASGVRLRHVRAYRRVCQSGVQPPVDAPQALWVLGSGAALDCLRAHCPADHALFGAAALVPSARLLEAAQRDGWRGPLCLCPPDAGALVAAAQHWRAEDAA